MNIVVLLSGGKGLRMDVRCPKQHLEVRERQIIEYTLTAFSKSNNVDAILIVSNADYIDQVRALQNQFSKVKWVILGGESRIESVNNAVHFLQTVCELDDKIIISDAVRPCITLREIAAVYDALNLFVAVTSGVEVYETLLKMEDGQIKTIIPRNGIVRQTAPEGYRFSTLKSLYIDIEPHIVSGYSNIGIDYLFSNGVQIGFVKSNPLNIKITTPDDLIVFETILEKGFNELLLS